MTPDVSAGEIFTAEALLYSMILRGNNDATIALAEHVSGSVPAFVSKMNEKARELGCVNTNFINPTGLHEAAMRTTVSDMAKIALYASRINLFMGKTAHSAASD